LTPDSRVTFIRSLRRNRGWRRKLRDTCNCEVPNTKETRRMGDHASDSNLHFLQSGGVKRYGYTKTSVKDGSDAGSNPVLTTNK